MGLAQRKIESAGFATVTLSNIPELTTAVGVPRLVGIEYPFGQTMGRPGDMDGQRAVLLATLQALEEMDAPGGVQHLPFRWRGTLQEAHAGPLSPPPIVGYLQPHPWQLPKLLTRSIPQEYRQKPSQGSD